MFKCPILTCAKSFLTKNSLANHLVKNKDLEHKNYYNTCKKIKTERYCQICRFKIHIGNFCGKCKKRIKENKKKELCYKNCRDCKKQLYGLYNKFVTNILCEECLIKRKKIKDKNRYSFIKKHKIEVKERKKLRKQKKQKDIEGLLVQIEKFVKDNGFSIPEICKKFNIGYATIELFFNEISKKYREIIEIKKKENRELGKKKVKLTWSLKTEEDFQKIFNRRPNNLEINFAKQITDRFPNSEIRHNVWKTIKVKDKFRRTEIDLRIQINDIAIIVLCDGEAFHGKKTFFNGDTVKKDEEVSQALFEMYPVVLRYSESEINKNFAIEHFIKILEQLKNKQITKIYRSWMI